MYNNPIGISPYDIINYIIARDNNYILATGDRKLKIFSERNGIEVIRTLKIIKLMVENGIISISEGINACNLLKDNNCTRIPLIDIDNFIDDLEKNSISCWIFLL